MAKRKYIDEDAQETEGYREVECPDCGAQLTLKFQRGRRLRRLRCPVCTNRVIISLEPEEAGPALIQLRGHDPQ